jgi:hypothetical protein
MPRDCESLGSLKSCDFQPKPHTKGLHNLVGCLVILRDPADPRTAVRIGKLFLGFSQWLALKQVVDVVNLV